MSILQWNLDGYYLKFEELRQLLSISNASVAFLQECKLGAQSQNAPQLFSLYSKLGPNAAQGGVAMLVHNTRSQYPVTLQTNLQAVAVQVQLNKKYTVCSVYLTPNENVNDNELINLINQLEAPFLILGDFNARHVKWRNYRINNKGRMFERLITRLHNICILNYNKPTHHIQTDSFTNVDLSICSPDLFNDFNWNVDDCPQASDRFPIYLSVKDYIPFTHVEKFNFDKADWTAYKLLINFNRDILAFNDMDCIINSFNQSIIAAAEAAIQSKGGEFRLRPVPCWGPEIKRILRQKKRAYRRYMRTKISDKIEFNRLRALARYKTKEAKRKGSLNKDTPMKSIWKNCKKIDRKGTSTPTTNIGRK